MVRFVALLQAAQDGDGIFDAGFPDDDRLESPFQCGVFFDVLFVFIERRRPDRAQFTAGQCGLQQIARIHGPFGFAGPHNGVQFVDEQDDFALALCHFLDDGFQPILKLAAKFCAGDQRPHVERDDLLVRQHRRHIPVEHAYRKAFNDGGLTHARLADQHGIVLRAPTQHLHRTANFLIPADHRVDLSLPCHLHQITAIFLQRLILGLRVLIRHALPAANIFKGFQNRVMAHTIHAENLTGFALHIRQRQQKMLGGNVLILQPVGLLLGACKHLLCRTAQAQLSSRGFRKPLQFRGDDLLDSSDAGPEFLEDRLNHTTLFGQQ